MMKVEENIPFASLTTFKVGGTARYVAHVDTDADIEEARMFARERSLPVIPLGSGSNMLAPDEGVHAVFLKISTDSMITRLEESDGFITVLAGAGMSWDACVKETVERGWWGLENLSGIPGTVGAAAVQNIGAYGAALNESVIDVIAYDLEKGKRTVIPNHECTFGYRTSIFKKERDKYLILSLRLTLSTIPKPRIAYRDVKEYFLKSNTEPTLSMIREAILEIRKGKFPPLQEYGTAGSFFMNPVLSESDAEVLAKKYPEMPLFAMPEGGVKVPLAWILDKVLNMKGEREGKAFLWGKQPIVIAAEAGATEADIRALSQKVIERVKKETGIAISPEVRLLSQ